MKARPGYLVSLVSALLLVIVNTAITSLNDRSLHHNAVRMEQVSDRSGGTVRDTGSAPQIEFNFRPFPARMAWWIVGTFVGGITLLGVFGIALEIGTRNRRSDHRT